MPVALLRFSLRSFPLRTEPSAPLGAGCPLAVSLVRPYRDTAAAARLQGLPPCRSPLSASGRLIPKATRCSLGLPPLQGSLPRRDRTGFPAPPPLRLPPDRCGRSFPETLFGVSLLGGIGSPLARLPPLLGSSHLVLSCNPDGQSRPRQEPRTKRISPLSGSVYGHP